MAADAVEPAVNVGSDFGAGGFAAGGFFCLLPFTQVLTTRTNEEGDHILAQLDVHGGAGEKDFGASGPDDDVDVEVVDGDFQCELPLAAESGGRWGVAVLQAGGVFTVSELSQVDVLFVGEFHGPLQGESGFVWIAAFGEPE